MPSSVHKPLLTDLDLVLLYPGVSAGDAYNMALHEKSGHESLKGYHVMRESEHRIYKPRIVEILKECAQRGRPVARQNYWVAEDNPSTGGWIKHSVPYKDHLETGSAKASTKMMLVMIKNDIDWIKVR